ncbi:hypothetical protein WMY93_002396 [Mugilogobius chulae]|uniref:MADF domain-containing protein n=1 Tax=Mugilogobius chulae TaxID=88201 RepID=A0AAW0PU89_9GOBI
MEDTLIVAVCNSRELYDTKSYHYRDRNKKDLAWRKVSEAVGEPEDVCRKKWKGLRDTYLKEKRRETEKRSGSAGGTKKKWKYSEVMSFLDPFIAPRQTTGNMRVEEDSEYFQDQESQQWKSQLFPMAVKLGLCQHLLLLLPPRLLVPLSLLLHPQGRQEEEDVPRSLHQRWKKRYWTRCVTSRPPESSPLMNSSSSA